MATPAPTPQELAAQAAAAHQFNVEAFTLLAIGLIVTVLRTYARIIVNGGIKGLQVDDLLAWIAAVRSCDHWYMDGYPDSDEKNRSSTQPRLASLTPWAMQRMVWRTMA